MDQGIRSLPLFPCSLLSHTMLWSGVDHHLWVVVFLSIMSLLSLLVNKGAKKGPGIAGKGILFGAVPMDDGPVLCATH